MEDISCSEVAAELKQAIEPMREQLVILSNERASYRPAEDRWSIKEVVGHLVDSACNNHQRFVRAQFTLELTFPKYEQNEWVAAGAYQEADWLSLVDLWYHYNRQIAGVMDTITDEAAKTTCVITPYEACTLGFLVKDYLDHLIHHWNRIAERIVDPDA